MQKPTTFKLVNNTNTKGEYGNGEWVTRVTVTREGDFSRSPLEVVDYPARCLFLCIINYLEVVD